ncbi:hypothetical protein [Pseudarthrobacter sp. NPDC058119]|uniref:hypothetical protein n=1 Tax=Pseudarthrobacter sp. NPDC058119 TaxID=3346348 RepID=UPI0036DBCB9F
MTPAPENLAALVDDMLLDVGLEQDADLRRALHSLGALASLPAPEPTGELAALLTAGGAARVEEPAPALDAAVGEREVEQDDEPPADELARRRRRRHRPTTLGLVLVAGMGLGVGGVAASSTPPGSSPVEQLLEDLSSWSSPVGDPSAAGYGYRAPKVASDAELAAGPEAAAGGASDAANLASRLLPGHAGASRHAGKGRTGTPPCAGPVGHEAAGGTCAPAGAAAAAQGNGAGPGKESGGTAAEEVPAAPGTASQGKAGPQASEPAPAAPGAANEPAKPAAGVVQGQAGSQGAGQGNGQKPASPAK